MEKLPGSSRLGEDKRSQQLIDYLDGLEEEINYPNLTHSAGLSQSVLRNQQANQTLAR